MPDSHETGPHSSGAHETMSDDAPVRRSFHLERGSTLGRYIVLEPIGAGGMSIVYAAYDPELDRRIALKVLRGVADPNSPIHSRERMRLLREAQAMARLTHPNVVPIYDAGSVGDRVFLAMHFVEGQTLTRWLAQDRPWREVVEFFTYAGRGLAAAHAAGLVHRDFKPDNVLVDRDGRVRVTDFGLARPSEGPRAVDGAPASASIESTPSGPTSLTSSARLDRPVTLAGAILGTPAYMSPEQHLALEVDARTDQFSFCVALWEALLGERPFAGSSVGELALAVTRGQMRTFPRESPVPGRIRRALERGLSRSPEQRFASMDALLDVLAPPIRRRPALIAGGALALVGLGAALSSFAGERYTAPDPCAAARTGLVEVYNPTIRAQLVQTVTATGGLGLEVTETLARLLDRHADQWREVATTACVAHRVAATESAELFDARMQCLGRRRAELEVNLSSLQAADEGSIAAIASQVFDAISPAECSDDVRFLEPQPPPDDPELRVVVERVHAALDVLDDVRSDDAALAEASALVREAEATGWQTLIGRARVIQAHIHEARGEIAESESLLRDAARAAAAGHDGSLMLRILGDLAYTMAYLQNRVSEAMQVAYLLELELARLDDRGPSPAVYTSLGAVYQAANQLDRAAAAYQRVLDLMNDAEFDNSFRRTVVLNNLGTIALTQGDAAAACEYFEQALALSTKAFGPDYPRNSDNHVNLCQAHLMRGDYALAQPHCDRALALVDGPRPKDVAAAARALHALTGLALATGDLEEAHRLLARGRPLTIAAFGEFGYAHVAIESWEISLALAEHRVDDAVRLADEIDARLAANPLGPGLEHLTAQYRAQFALARGDGARALELATTAIASAGVDPRHPSLVELLTFQGEALVLLGRLDEAAPHFERALEIRTTRGGEPYLAARAGLALAKIVLGRGESGRARALVLAAREDVRPIERRDPAFVIELDQWLEAHP